MNEWAELRETSQLDLLKFTCMELLWWLLDKISEIS